MRADEAAADAHDRHAVLAFVADDAVYWFSDESSHLGKAAVERAIGDNFESIYDETYVIDQLRWLCRTDDVAVCVYSSGGPGVVDGERVGGSGRGTNVLRRDDDRWAVAHEHLSKGPAS